MTQEEMEFFDSREVAGSAQAGAAAIPAAAPAPLSHFSYFSEIEQHFSKRRRSHMLVSPLDWSLMETWKQRGIPLEVVICGIDGAFDSYEAQPVKYRKVNSLFYCEQKVEECFGQFNESRVGANAPSENEQQAGAESSEFSKDEVLEYLLDRLARLDSVEVQDRPALAEAAARAMVRMAGVIDGVRGGVAPKLSVLEREVTAIESILLESAEASLSADEKQKLESETKGQFKPYKKSMPKEVYEQALGNYRRKRITQNLRIPRLSLFYMR